MYILKIIPLESGLPESVFTYFAKDKISLGGLVEIKIKNRSLSGVVMSVSPLSDNKMEVRNSDFALKKISRVMREEFISPVLLESLYDVAILTGTRLHILLDNFMQRDILKILAEKRVTGTGTGEVNDGIVVGSTSSFGGGQGEVRILVGDKKDRLGYYKNMLRDYLARDEGVVFFFPTINELEEFKSEIEKGIEKYCYSLHSEIKAKESEKIKSILLSNSDSRSKIIFSTPSILPFVLKDYLNIKKVIIEKENSFYYFGANKNKIDARLMLKKLSHDLQISLILSSHIPSLETFKNIKEKKIIEINKNKSLNLSLDPVFMKDEYSSKFSILNLAKQNGLRDAFFINEKEEEILEKSKLSKVYFAKELIVKLENLKEKYKTKKEEEEFDKKIFVYTKRKGLFTEMVCSDCNTSLTCKKCGKSFILREKNEMRILHCTSCKENMVLEKDKEVHCEYCHSWNIRPLGVATDGIASNLREAGFNVHTLDSENVKTRAAAIKAIKSWKKDSVSILVGTEMAINFLPANSVDVAIVASLDSYFSMPEINVDEKIIHTVYDIKEKIRGGDESLDAEIFIETRLPDYEIWKYVKENKSSEFLEKELVNRKDFELPPYVKIVKIIIEENKIKQDIEEIKENLIRKFKNLKIDIEKIIWHTEKNTQSTLCILFIKNEAWEYMDEVTNASKPTDLAKDINTLAQAFKIEINPDSLYR